MTTGKYKLPSFYSKHLGPKLAERVGEILSRTHEEQVSLYEELAIARASACEAIALSQPLWDPELSRKLQPETRALMVTTLGEAMKTVKEFVLAAAKLEQESGDKVSLKVLNLIVTQICQAVNEVCGTENLAIAEAICNAIDEKVRLPMNDRLNPRIDVKVE